MSLHYFLEPLSMYAEEKEKERFQIWMRIAKKKNLVKHSSRTMAPVHNCVNYVKVARYLAQILNEKAALS